jgi:hypothetical protein
MKKKTVATSRPGVMAAPRAAPLVSFEYFIKNYPGPEQVTMQVTSTINGIGCALYA